MKRINDWEIKARHFLEDRAAMPFQWGVNDCCLFSADFVLLITNYDFAEDFRGRYTTRLGATKQLLRVGARDVEGLMELIECPNFPQQPINFAQRGDVMLRECEIHGSALGICDGIRSAFVTEIGLTFYPTRSCKRSWRV